MKENEADSTCSTHGWKDTRMDLREIIWELVDWMHLTSGYGRMAALVNTAVNLEVQ
jgi:hypothetical protein